MERPPYVTYLDFCEDVIMVICLFITIYTMTKLVYYNLFKRYSLMNCHLSPTMLIYLMTHIFCASTSMFFHFYMIVYWRQNTTIYKPEMIYWLGLFASNYMVVAPSALFFLMFERCLAFKLGYSYTKSIKRDVIALNVVAILLTYSVSTMYYLLELPLNPNIGWLYKKIAEF